MKRRGVFQRRQGANGEVIGKLNYFRQMNNARYVGISFPESSGRTDTSPLQDGVSSNLHHSPPDLIC